MEVTREEAKRILRRLELEAYSSIVSTFRAQGDLNREKKKLLTDLGVHLSISTERHRAEVRRAYSDDRLGSVAECICGPSTCSEWAAEGRRLVPLMPRLVPQTVLSGTATASANAAAAANAQIAQAKKTGISSGQTSKESDGSSIKHSPSKPLARQSSETVDVEYDSDDNKSRKKRKLSQSLTSPKPVQKISLNPSMVGTKTIAKASSVSTSTMTKVGKPSTSAGTVKATQKLVLPASQSQVKLLTKTVSINQTVSQAKTMLNYKTVTATNPAAVKVQTVMSHSTPKAQVKLTGPSKNVLVPKASISTSPSKPAGVSPVKTGISMSMTAKQRGKQPAKFKPLPGAVKFKSVNALAMGMLSTPVTMVTPTTNISTISGSVISNAQPDVRSLQATGGVKSHAANKTAQPSMTAVTTGAKTIPLQSSVSSTITKIPISTTQSSIARVPSTTTLPSSAKTVVMTTIVGGTKKVVLSVPAPVTPVQPVPITNTAKPTKTTGLPTQQVLSTGDSTTKQDAPVKVVTVPSLECTEPSSVLQAPVPIVPKQSPAQVATSLSRTRPLQTLLPAPPKPVIVTAANTLPGNTVVRKLPQILPAPAKTPIMIPISKATGSQLVSTATVSSTGKVPLVQFVAKTTQPSVVTKLCVSKTVPIVTSKVSTSSAKLQALPGQQVIGNNQTVPAKTITTTGQDDKTTSLQVSGSVGMKDKTDVKKLISNIDNEDKDTLECDEVKTDSNTSSEDDSLLVCSETIDSGTGLQEINTQEVTADVATTGTSVDVTVTSTPFETTDQFEKVDDKPLSPNDVQDNSPVEKSPISCIPQKNISENPKVVVEVLDAIRVESELSDTIKESKEDDNKDNEKEKDYELDGKNDHGNDFKNAMIDEDFDAVASFLETFSANTCANNSEAEKDDIGVVNNSLPVATDIAAKKNENNLDSEKHENELVVSSSETKRDTSELSSMTSSILSDFDVFDTPTIEQQSDKVSTNVTSQKTAVTSIAPSYNVLHTTKDVPNDSINSAPTNQEYKSIPLPNTNTIQSLKEVAQKSINQNNTNNITNFNQHTNVASGKSNEFSHTDPVNLGLSSFSDSSSLGSFSVETHSAGTNEAHASTSSDGEELTESERLALEAIANVRTSSRKRKPPTVLTLSPPRQTSGWVRGALSLLQKVCSYRGQGRKKGDYSAASWFLRPVDPNEAPGYFKVIKNPMDLSTIKSKLETGVYRDYMEFYEDMVLIKTNCFKYNPPGHDIWKDCEEVFSYFDAEYEKMLERWEKCHVSPAKKPRTMPKQELASSASWCEAKLVLVLSIQVVHCEPIPTELFSEACKRVYVACDAGGLWLPPFI